MERRMILLEDLRQVIPYAENSGPSCSTENRPLFGSFQAGKGYLLGRILACQDGFMVHNAYSHRMEVLEELKP